MFTMLNFKQRFYRALLSSLFMSFFAAVSINLKAQSDNKDVTITASGSGATIEEARRSALRTATEQAFGAFISTKTEMFNDEIITDQMASVSSGNIKSYEILNEGQFPNSRWGVTLKAVVSVDKLTSFVQAQGVEIDVKGGLFAMNIKQQLLNEQGEIETIYDMVGLLHETMQTAFDYTLTSGEPQSLDAQSENWEVPLQVTATCNENVGFCANYFVNTMNSISLSGEEIESYRLLNKQTFPIQISYDGRSWIHHLRKAESISCIMAFTSNWYGYTRLFSVDSGLDESLGSGTVEWSNEMHKNNVSEFKRWRYFNGQLGYHGYENECPRVHFPNVGEDLATFSWNDKRTLNQIERMTGYSVKPRGVVSKYSNGGFVVYDNKGNGLIVAVFGGSGNWHEADKACEELSIGGYSDWRLPSRHELRKIHQNLYSEGFNCGIKSTLWSSAKYYDQASIFDFSSNHAPRKYLSWDNPWRAVRSYSSTGFDPQALPTKGNSESCSCSETRSDNFRGTWPIFVGGEGALEEYLRVKSSTFKGEVRVCFVVDCCGRVTDPEIVSGLSPEADEIALELLRKMPNWMPARVGDKKINAELGYSVIFE